MKNVILTIVFLLALNASLPSQNKEKLPIEKDSTASYPEYQKREIQKILQQWSNTSNAAGMVFAKTDKGSFATLETYSNGGDYHRLQEGSANNGLKFSTERYDKLNDYVFVKGSFSFNLNKEKDRAWSDVFNTYNANPYIYGSSIKGDYETQLYKLNLRVYTVPYKRLNFGLLVDYQVADMARQKDPRSRSYLLNYSLIPSIVYNIDNNNKLGINLLYRYNKEKMPGLTTVQTDPNLQYYTFTGLENAVGRIGGYKGFSRQFTGDALGADIQYGFSNEQLNWLISGGVEYYQEETLGDKKQSPGSYNAYKYNIYSNLLLKGSKYLHNFQAKAASVDGGADEFRQILIAERDTLTGISTQIWETIYTYKNRYVVKTAEVDASWKLYSMDKSGDGYKWSAGLSANYSSFENIYYLQKSEYGADKLSFGMDASYRLWNNKYNKLILETQAVAGLSLDSKLNVNRETEVYKSILRSDLEYHNLNTFYVSGSLLYTFPLQFVKNSKLTGYSKLYGGNVFATDNIGWYNIGIAIGLLTL